MRLRRRSFSLLALISALPFPLPAARSLSNTQLQEIVSSLAYRLFPHAELDFSRYQRLAETFIEADFDRALRMATLLASDTFLQLSPGERLRRMALIEADAGFLALRMHVLMGLYSDLKVTGRFGYQGPSLAQGGYIKRGFDDLSWLPEPKSNAV